MRKSTVVFVELGMLGGIVAAGYTLPDSTRLSTFLVASGACFALGNALLIMKLMRPKERQKEPPKNGAWIHILRALAILAFGWLLILLMSRR